MGRSFIILQMLPINVVRRLFAVGYNYNLRDVFIGHTRLLAQDRIRAIMEYIKEDEPLRNKQLRYGTKLSSTLKFYQTYEDMSKEEREAEYIRMKERKYNFFDNNTTTLVHDFI